MSQLLEAELLAKHRKERKELQTQIQSLKKSCVKSDKKKKKEVTELIARLEQELNEKQNKELEELNLNDLKVSECGELNGEELPEVRVTRAQKRRNKKELVSKEREERILKEEEENKNGPRIIESEKIDAILKEMGLKLYSVPPDGNCLYCSINHQLETTNRNRFNVKSLRKLTADYMRSNQEDFLPFMHSESDEEFTTKQYEEYCRKVEKTTEWGGQIEILAISNALKCAVKVIQADSSPMVQGEAFAGSPLVITYHRHLYGLGEHYNSTVPL